MARRKGTTVVRCKHGRWLSCCRECCPEFARKVADLGRDAEEADEHNRRLFLAECARRGLTLKTN